MIKNVKGFSEFSIFIGLSLMYCIWMAAVFMISSVEATFMLAVVALAVDLYVNYKFVTHYYVFMLASLAPAVLCAVLFELNPAYSYADGTFCAMILAALRILLSVIESVKRKKYACIPLSVILSASVLYLSFAVNDYQYDVLHALGIFSPK